eukprot:gene13245-biopygen14080
MDTRPPSGPLLPAYIFWMGRGPRQRARRHPRQREQPMENAAPQAGIAKGWGYKANGGNCGARGAADTGRVLPDQSGHIGSGKVGRVESGRMESGRIVLARSGSARGRCPDRRPDRPGRCPDRPMRPDPLGQASRPPGVTGHARATPAPCPRHARATVL